MQFCFTKCTQETNGKLVDGKKSNVNLPFHGGMFLSSDLIASSFCKVEREKEGALFAHR